MTRLDRATTMTDDDATLGSIARIIRGVAELTPNTANRPTGMILKKQREIPLVRRDEDPVFVRKLWRRDFPWSRNDEGTASHASGGTPTCSHPGEEGTCRPGRPPRSRRSSRRCRRRLPRRRPGGRFCQARRSPQFRSRSTRRSDHRCQVRALEHWLAAHDHGPQGDRRRAARRWGTGDSTSCLPLVSVLR